MNRFHSACAAIQGPAANSRRAISASIAVSPSAFRSADYLALNIRNVFGKDQADGARPQAQFTTHQDSSPVTTSVLLNTFNHGPFIEECIESLLVQTVLPNEIIVYDDGSEDDTVARLRQYASRITLIQGTALAMPSHLRQANAVHTAFARSTGKLIFLLDGDDRFKRDK